MGTPRVYGSSRRIGILLLLESMTSSRRRFGLNDSFITHFINSFHMKISARIPDDQGKLFVAEAALTSEQLIAEFSAQCASGHPFIVAIAPSKTKGRVSVYLAQQRPVSNGKNMDSDPDGMGLLPQSLHGLMGFTAPIVRTIISPLESEMQASGLDVGSIFSIGGINFTIAQKDTLRPDNDYERLNPRQSRPDEHGNSYVYVNKGNLPIFRQHQLMELNPEGVAIDNNGAPTAVDQCFDFKRGANLNQYIQAMELVIEKRREAEMAAAVGEGAVQG